MSCLPPEANFIDPSEWPFPDIIAGFIPIIWTSGSYIPELQESNPWLGLLVPDRVSWIGATVDIYFFSNSRSLNGCYLSFPPTRVRISFSCSCGMHQFFIEVSSGKRTFFRNLWNVPGTWTAINDVITIPGSVSRCVEKYFPRETYLQIDLRLIGSWIELMRNYSVSSTGNAADWFQHILDNQEDDAIGLRDQCTGCAYGLLPRYFRDEISTLESIREAYDQLPGFPVNEGDFGYIDLSEKSLIVVNAIEYTYLIYKELQFLCEFPILISGSGELKPECVEVTNELPPLPPDNDPRWVTQCNSSNSTCSLSGVRGSSSYDASRGEYGVSVFRDGVYYNTSINQLPRDWIPETPDPPLPGNPRKEYTVFYYQIIKDKKITAVDGGDGVCRTFFLKEVTTIKLEEILTYETNVQGDRTPESIANVQAEAAYINSWDQQIFDNKSSCNFMFNAPPPPPVIDRKEKNDEEGNCYIQGKINISLLGNMDKKIRIGTDGEIDRARNIVAPIVRSETAQAIGLPTGITVPFKFRMPTGKATLGGVTVNVIGTALIAITFGNINDQILINLEEIFAYYNFAQQVLGFLVPGKVMITDLQAFCE